MKKRIFCACVLFAASFFASSARSAFSQSPRLSASQIVKSVDENLTFAEGEMTMRMADVRADGARKEFDIKVIYKKDKGTLLEFVGPAREKGKKVLMVKDNMWMFVPGISRPVRLSGRDSFMGTAFSNRDLTDFDMNNDYESKITGGNDAEYELELLATNKNVTYPRVVITVEKKRLLPVKQYLYTVSGNLIKTLEFSDVKDIGGRMRPSLMTVKDVLSQGNVTAVVFESMTEKKVDERIFSPQNLAR